jgi:uncharacterized NAD-dependent epimerase/dehydratase family protein
MTCNPLTQLRDRAPYDIYSIDRVMDRATRGMQSIVRERALNDTQSIDRVGGQSPTRHPYLVHVTIHIKATTVALLVTLYSQHVQINMNDITEQKNVVNLINIVVPTVICKVIIYGHIYNICFPLITITPVPSVLFLLRTA